MANKIIDITGQRYGKLVVQRYSGNKKWACKCDCGNDTLATGSQLRNGARTSCGCSWGNKIDLTGKIFGQLVVEKYEGNKQWKCLCDCGNTKVIAGSSLRDSSTKSCGCAIKKAPELNGHTFGDWVVLNYLGYGKWACKCTCGVIKTMITSDIVNSHGSNKCSHKNLTGDQYWNWSVLSSYNNTYECECECGKIETLSYTDLVRGIRKSCGCGQFQHKDLKNNIFGELTAIKYAGDSKWVCKCSCGEERVVLAYYLKSGFVQDCGHSGLEKSRKTRIERYLDLSSTKKNNPRTEYQMQCVSSAELMELCMTSSFKKAPYCFELCELLNLTPSAVYKYVHKYGLEHKMNKGGSKLEKEVYDYITTIYNGIVHRQIKSILTNKLEIDIYLPDLNTGIEVNGDYWHSDIMKDKYYHQNKTIEAIKNKIHLIHIFEYEWNNKTTRDKLKNYIKSLIGTNNIRVGARACAVTEITRAEIKEFEDTYHMQRHCAASVYYGLMDNSNNILATMSFGSPRFDNQADWELIRYCTNGTHIHGGFAKILKHFTMSYSPETIISYCDVSKFSGNTYIKNGFKATANDLSTPNYKWLLKYTNKEAKEAGTKLLSRYQTQKHRLVNAGIGTIEQTEDEIMHKLGYIKIYDSGNLKFTWQQTEVK